MVLEQTMSSQSRWRSNVSFSDRLINVFKMQVDFSYLYAPNLHRIIEVFFALLTLHVWAVHHLIELHQYR